MFPPNKKGVHAGFRVTQHRDVDNNSQLHFSIILDLNIKRIIDSILENNSDLLCNLREFEIEPRYMSDFQNDTFE